MALSSVATAVFSLNLGIFCFMWGSGILIANLGFLTLVKFSKCMLYYCIFHSRIEYSSFTGAMCRVSRKPV